MMKIDRMKRFMAVPLLGMVFSTALFGQDTTKAAPEKMITRMMTIQFGYANMGNSTFRQFYQPYGDELNQNYWTFGLASTSEYKRLITGATLQGGMTKPVTLVDYAGPGHNYQISSNFGNIMLHLGYTLVNTDRIKFYPILGIGGGRVALQLQSLDNVSLSTISASKGTEITVYKYMTFFDAGLGFDVLIKAPKATEGKEYGGVLGIRAGYTQGVGVGNWGYNSGTVTDNPSYNPGTIYVKANIGFYGKMPKGFNHWKGMH